MKQLFVQDDTDNFSKVPNKTSKSKAKRTPKKPKRSEAPPPKEKKPAALRKRARSTFVEEASEEEEIRPRKRMKISHLVDEDYVP